MINLIKRYWKYLIGIFIFLIAIIVSIILNNSEKKNEEISKTTTPKVEKLSSKKEETARNTVFVDVKGAVNAPGVYELDSGKRVIDAINLAGGLKENADTVNLNLSKKITDEMYIIVYTKEEIYNYKKDNDKKSEIKCASFECVCPDVSNNACIESSNEKKDNSFNEEQKEINTKISINTATKEELMSLNGIGESKADAIISYRKENGLFEKIEDIKNVSGIGDAVYEKIKDSITV